MRVKILCVVLSAMMTVGFSPRNVIYNILQNKPKRTNSMDLITKSMNNSKQVKVLNSNDEVKKETETELKSKSKEVTKKKMNKNSYILGLDISKWNGNINWDLVEKANIEFVIIRAGYGTTYEDPYFRKNIEEAKKRGMLLGVYWFSYATNSRGARQEALKCMDVIKDYRKDIDLPIFYDFEYDSVNYASRRGVHISKERASSMADAFCKTIEEHKYQAGIYTNIDYTRRYFTKDVLSKYHTWIAQWTSECTYKDKYIIWQKTERFYIGNKKFDLNRFYPGRYDEKDI